MAEDIADKLNEPRRVRVDNITVQHHDLDQFIDAQEFCDEKEALKSRKLPIRYAKIRPGGAP